MYHNNKNKKGFSLAEAMIFLLVACLLMAASMPLITKRHMLLGERAPHGKWACKLIDGQLHSATAANANQALPPDEKWKAGCKFPELPSAVIYVIIRIIGGGSGGFAGSVDVGKSELSDIMFPSKQDGEIYRVEETGRYEINFNGLKGHQGTLYPSFVSIVLDGKTFKTCNFEEAKADDSVASVRFEYDLQRYDKLYFKHKYKDKEENVDNRFNGTGEKLCNHSAPISASWTDEFGKTHTEPYYFAKVEHYPGDAGKTVQLVLQRGISAPVVLAEIKGSGGGFYFSSADACQIECSQRYLGQIDRRSSEWTLTNFITVGDSVKFPSMTKVSSSTPSTIKSKSNTLKAFGGCGGAAGQANTILMLKPEKTDFDIKIGKGGGIEGDGYKTSFDYITAQGGIGCSAAGPNSFPEGRDGDVPSYIADVDSEGGKGGEGKIGSPVPEMEKLNAGDGKGIGAGGGGGGVSFNILTSVKEFLESGDFSKVDELKKLGIGGKGTSGGIIITW